MKYILLFIVFLVSFAIVFAVLRTKKEVNEETQEFKEDHWKSLGDDWEVWFDEHQKTCPECGPPDLGMCMEAYEKLMTVIRELKDSGYTPDFPHPLFPESYKHQH